MNPSPTPTVKPKNWLLLQSRVWHRWAGVIAALFLVVVSLTGIVLNYKKPIFQTLGLEPAPLAGDKEKTSSSAKSAGEPRQASHLQTLPVSMAQALAVAREQWGDAPLERVELKLEQGEWLYKIKRQGGAEIWISAATGAHFSKGAYEKARRAPDGTAIKSFDWGKFVLDLHTGKIGGPVGVAVMTGVAGVLFFLTLSGLYLWLKPLLLRRANAAARPSPAVAEGQARGALQTGVARAPTPATAARHGAGTS
ncbi:MAG: PepSY domain-containing protein [Verrucomicrobiae bacterium]|nr:PepSY domain-containing protein [Verrucomicrobiae bacterium]